MENIEICRNLLLKICECGQKNPNPPHIQDLFPFKHYFNSEGNLIQEKLSEIDGLWTRREILTRFLFLQAVLDQGPDIVGIRHLLKDVTNGLYLKEIRFLHKPLDFFRELGISVDEILQKHENIKLTRAEIWATENKSTAGRYNLFMDNSTQVLGYAIYRWGVPLSVPYLLEKDFSKINKISTEPLVDYLENYDSAEIMSQEVKDNQRYGLGKAIGDKAAHLFAKWYVHTFSLCRKKAISWNKISYELPFDSNAGRVLFRTGFLTNIASLKNYENWEVIQKNAGKGGEHYIRVTNIRGKKVQTISIESDLGSQYKEISTQYLKTRKRFPSSMEIQQLPNAFLKETKYGIGDLDDGLIYIGTNFCFNHNEPKCVKCPINEICIGFQEKQEFISNFRT